MCCGRLKQAEVTFIQYLEELADAERTITMPANEVNRLVDHFGDRVRH